MRYNVPQNVDIEDTIVGFLTWKQLLMFVGAGVVLLLIYRFVDLSLFILIASITVGITGVFAFVRPYNQSMAEFLTNIILFQTKSKEYIWRREGAQFKDPKDLPKNQNVIVMHKKVPQKNMEQLANIIDNRGNNISTDDIFAIPNLQTKKAPTTSNSEEDEFKNATQSSATSKNSINISGQAATTPNSTNNNPLTSNGDQGLNNSTTRENNPINQKPEKNINNQPLNQAKTNETEVNVLTENDQTKNTITQAPNNPQASKGPQTSPANQASSSSGSLNSLTSSTPNSTPTQNPNRANNQLSSNIAFDLAPKKEEKQNVPDFFQSQTPDSPATPVDSQNPLIQANNQNSNLNPSNNERPQTPLDQDIKQQTTQNHSTGLNSITPNQAAQIEHPTQNMAPQNPVQPNQNQPQQQFQPQPQQAQQPNQNYQPVGLNSLSQNPSGRLKLDEI